MTEQLDDEDRARIAWADREMLKRRVAALQKCTMLPGSSDKRFVRQVADQVAAEVVDLTGKQKLHVLRLCWRFRRQIARALVPDVNPDDPLSGHFAGWASVPKPATTHRDRLAAADLRRS